MDLENQISISSLSYAKLYTKLNEALDFVHIALNHSIEHLQHLQHLVTKHTCDNESNFLTQLVIY